MRGRVRAGGGLGVMCMRGRWLGAAPPAAPGLIPLSVREIRRLLAAELRPPRPPGHAARWLQRRRRRRARSRWFRKRARPRRNHLQVR